MKMVSLQLKDLRIRYTQWSLESKQRTECLHALVQIGSNGIYHVSTFFAVFDTQDGWTWNRFHPNYLKSPYLSTDSVSLNHYFNDDTSCSTEGIEQSSLTQTTTLSGQGKPSELPKRQVCIYIVKSLHYIPFLYIPKYEYAHQCCPKALSA